MAKASKGSAQRENESLLGKNGSPQFRIELPAVNLRSSIAERSEKRNPLKSTRQPEEMMEQFKELIGTQLAQTLAGFAFKKRESCVLRPSDVGWQAISIEVLPTASPGIGKLAAHAKTRIEALEALYTPLHPFLKPKDAKAHATLTANCDGLLSDKTLAHGFGLDNASVIRFAERYATALKSDVIPWLERYSDEQAVYAGLANGNPQNWITSDRLTRFPVLLAILAKRRDATAFDVVAAEFEEWCKQKHAVVYAPLATAMLKLRPTPK